jgi:hypothetical protein
MEEARTEMPGLRAVGGDPAFSDRLTARGVRCGDACPEPMSSPERISSPVQEPLRELSCADSKREPIRDCSKSILKEAVVSCLCRWSWLASSFLIASP